MLLDERYYCCAYVVHVASMMLCACGVVYTQHVYMLFMQSYVQDGIDSVVQILHMSVAYRCCYVHVGYDVLCAYGVVHMLDMQCYVQMMLCTCWICSTMYIRCFMHVVHMVLVRMVLCA